MCTISYEAFLNETKKEVEQNENLQFILGDGDVTPGKLQTQVHVLSYE